MEEHNNAEYWVESDNSELIWKLHHPDLEPSRYLNTDTRNMVVSITAAYYGWLDYLMVWASDDRDIKKAEECKNAEIVLGKRLQALIRPNVDLLRQSSMEAMSQGKATVVPMVTHPKCPLLIDPRVLCENLRFRLVSSRIVLEVWENVVEKCYKNSKYHEFVSRYAIGSRIATTILPVVKYCLQETVSEFEKLCGSKVRMLGPFIVPEGRLKIKKVLTPNGAKYLPQIIC